MRFTRPYGADTPLADRLQMPSPSARPRDRSHTPINKSRRHSLYGLICNTTTPFPTSSPNVPSRASPIIPPVSSLNTGGRQTTPGESSPIAPPNGQMPNFPANNSPETADPDPHPNSAHVSSETNGCSPTPPHDFPGSGRKPSNPPSSGSSDPNSSAPSDSSSFNTGANTAGSLDSAFGAFASEVRSEFKSIRGEMQHTRELLTTQSTKSKARKHGAFTTKTPPRPRTAARTEMMVS